MANRFKKLLGGGSGGGVTGLTSASSGTALADNKVVRGDGTTGIQGSAIGITDGGNIDIPGVATKITFDSSVSGAPQIGRNAAAVRINANDGTEVPLQVGSLELQNSAAASVVYDVQVGNSKQIAFSDGVDFTRGLGKGSGSGGSVLRITDGSTGNGFLQTAGFKRKTADQTVTNSTTLVDDSHLSVSLAAGRSYGFKFILFATEIMTSGLKIALAGTATHTNIIADVTYIPLGDLTASLSNRLTAVGTGYDTATGFTSSRVIIEGTTTVNAAGTFLVQFAQSIETGAAETATLLRGSTLEVWDIQ